MRGNSCNLKRFYLRLFSLNIILSCPDLWGPGIPGQIRGKRGASWAHSPSGGGWSPSYTVGASTKERASVPFPGAGALFVLSLPDPAESAETELFHHDRGVEVGAVLGDKAVR